MTATDAPSGDAPADETPPHRRRLPPPPTRRQFVLLMLALLYLAGSLGYVLGSRPSRRPGKDSVDAGFLYDMTTHHEQAMTMSNLELVNGEERAVTVLAREILSSQSYEVGLMDQQLADWDLPPFRSGTEPPFRSGTEPPFRSGTEPPFRSGTEPAENPSSQAMDWMGMAVAADQMPGMATEEELTRLRQARGRDADAVFITLMQDHHRGGVHMAEYAAEHASSKFVRTLAERMARNQRIEIDDLEHARARSGLAAGPTS